MGAQVPLRNYLAEAGGIALLLFLLRLFPGYWSGNNKNLDRPPALWPYSSEFYRGAIVRSYLVMMIGWATGLMIVAYSFVVEDNVDARVFWSWFALFMLELLTWGTVTFFNQPKFLVPQRMRAEPGVFQAWWQREHRAMPHLRLRHWVARRVFWALMVAALITVVGRWALPRVGYAGALVACLSAVVLFALVQLRFDPDFRRDNPGRWPSFGAASVRRDRAVHRER